MYMYNKKRYEKIKKFRIKQKKRPEMRTKSLKIEFISIYEPIIQTLCQRSFVL